MISIRTGHLTISGGATIRRRTKPVLGVFAVAVVAIATVFTPSASADTVPLSSVASDGFSRTVTSGWGASDVGGNYTVSGQAGSFSVADGKGWIAGILPGKSAGARLSQVSLLDASIKGELTVQSVPSASLGLHSAIEARRQTDGTAYRGRVRLTPGGKLSVGVSRNDGAAETGLGSVALPTAVVAGQAINLEMQISGSTPVVVKVRAWLVSKPAPSWQVSVSDNSTSRVAKPGAVGIWDYVSAASVPTTVKHDSLVVTNLPSAHVNADFNSLPLGQVAPSAFNGVMGPTNTSAPAYDDLTVVSDPRGSGRVLRTKLKAGTIHSSNGGDSGDNLFIKLPSAYDQACVQYDIHFDSNFDWSLGGKLPGLEGVAPGVAPATPTGGKVTNLGWSGRLMWLGPKAYSWAGPTNMAVSYMYHPGQAGTYGDNIRWNKPFVAGTWHTVKQCYVMNTVGRADGVLRAWMDGQMVVNNTAFTYRVRDDVHINYIVFSLFRGGNTLSWAGSRDSYVDIDNFSVTSS